MDNLKYLLPCFAAGVKDAFALPSSIAILWKVLPIRNNTIKCILLNGCLFMGSIFLFEYLIKPILLFIGFGVILSSDTTVTQQSGNETLSTSATPTNGTSSNSGFYSYFPAMGLVMTAVYYTLWILPVYILSFIFNSLWYQDIADTAYAFQVGKVTGAIAAGGFRITISARIADEGFRLVLQTALTLQIFLLHFIPVIGSYVSFVYLAWSCALYCFEYKWVNKGWNLEQRLEYFETHWAYLLGFGTPFAFSIFYWNVFVSGGLFAIFFPLFIVMANSANPIAPNPEEIVPSLRRLPIFGPSKHVTNLLLNKIKYNGKKK